MADPFAGEIPDRQRFLHEALRSKKVWGLKSINGWAVFPPDRQRVLLLWSTEQEALNFARGEWKEYSPAPIPLSLFLNRWLARAVEEDDPVHHELLKLNWLASVGVEMVGVNWLPRYHGLEDSPNKLRQELVMAAGGHRELLASEIPLASALVGRWRSDRHGGIIGILNAAEPNFVQELSLRANRTASWRFLFPEFVDDTDKRAPFPPTWQVSADGLLELFLPIAPMPEHGIPDWIREAERWDVLEITESTLTLSDRRYDGESIHTFRRVSDDHSPVQ